MPLAAKVTRMLSSLSSDLEKGVQHDAGFTNAPLPVLDREAQVQATLEDFRYAVGIQNSEDMKKRARPNIGIYERVCKTENQYKKKFSWYSWMINSALGLQIVFAAALTALGAGNGPRSAVTAFGALNTILAGFLSFTKGSGLPNRFKYYKEEVTKLREYIEQRERELSRGDPRVNLQQEIAIIEEMYASLKRDIEVNTPEAYVSRTKEQIRAPQIDINRYTAGARNDVDNRIHDINEKISGGKRDFEDRILQSRTGAESGIRDIRAGINDRLTSARSGLASYLSQGKSEAETRLRDSEARLRDTRTDVSDRYNQTRLDLDDQYDRTRQDLDDRLSRERLGIESRLNDTRADINAQVSATRSGVESQYDSARIATASQVENTRHGLETRIEDTRAGITSQVEDTRHGMEERMKEVQAQVKEQEDKIMGIAEKVASKVLEVTQKRHHDEHKS